MLEETRGETMKFRKKPIIIEAIRWDGDNCEEIIEFTKGKALIINDIGGSADGEGYPQQYIKLIINTLEGDMEAKLNDWIIKGVNGEFYPCKPDIFEKTYEWLVQDEKTE
jgi:uncharacterized protein YeeX (DUF496 family)